MPIKVAYPSSGGNWRWPNKRLPLPTDTKNYDWSDSNLPWSYTSTSAWESKTPAGVPIVNISTASGDFWTNLNATVNAQPGRFICRLSEGDYELDQFRMIGVSGSPNYATGFWFPKLAGLIGAGPDKTFVSMKANSMSTDQLNQLQTWGSSDGPNQLNMFRIDSKTTEPAFLGGITFRADWQQNLPTAGTISGGNPPVFPQPAPHRGPTFYGETSFTAQAEVWYCRFQGAGRAISSAPPFEHANIESGRGIIRYFNCEIDGRISPEYSVNRERKCGPIMFNKEVEGSMTDCWIHHSNISRYAVNDNTITTDPLSRQYNITRCKAEQITNTRNTEPTMNGGVSMGGYTNASPFGWESTNAQINVTDCIVKQDNLYTNGQIAQHLQLTGVDGWNPSGGRMTVIGGTYTNAWTQLNGFLCMRIPSATMWYVDGLDNTLTIRETPTSPRKAPHVYTGSWPISSGYISSNGLSPETHYIVRLS